MTITLRQHQQQGVEIARQRPRFAFFHEPGLGKTIMSGAIVADAKARGFPGRTLVLAPKSILRSAWEADMGKVGLTCRVVWHQSAKARERLIAEATEDVLVLNYEAFKKHLPDLYKANVRRLIVDESSKVKAHDSQITRACIAFADAMQSVYVLSGTPAPNDHTEYWGQLRVVSKDAFAQNYWKFAHHYFFPIKREVRGRSCTVGWKPNPDTRDEFENRLRHWSWSLRKQDCLDLPEQTDVVVPVELGAEARAYRQMLAEARVALADGRETATVQQKVIKLRQITGGAVIDGGVAHPIGTAKLDALADILDSIGPRPVVIWAEFTSEIRRIRDAIAAGGEVVGVIDGSVGMEDRARHIADFQAGRLKRLVCHPAAAGHGITLTAASYAVYYSHGYSYEQHRQSRDRIHRMGQTQACTYYHLVAAGTVDERVMRALAGKQDAHEAVMELLSQPEAVAA